MGYLLGCCSSAWLLLWYDLLIKDVALLILAPLMWFSLYLRWFVFRAGRCGLKWANNIQPLASTH
jgi:hypothetical protein